MRSKAFPKRIARISQRFKLKSIVGNFLCYKKCNLKWIVWLNVIKLNIHLHSSSYQHINICTVVFKWHFCLMLIAFYVPQRQCNVKHHSIYIHFSNKKTVNVSNLFISNKRRMLSECRENRTKKKKTPFHFENRPRSSRMQRTNSNLKKFLPFSPNAYDVCVRMTAYDMYGIARTREIYNNSQHFECSETKCAESKQQKYDENSSFIHCFRFRFYIDKKYNIRI